MSLPIVLLLTLTPMPLITQVAVKLKRDSAARDLWAVLSELPAPALLLKTNLLRFVLDLVGAPHSQAEAGEIYSMMLMLIRCWY